MHVGARFTPNRWGKSGPGQHFYPGSNFKSISTMHIVFVYTEAEMHILRVIQSILLFPFVCEAVGEVEWKRGPELPPPYPTVAPETWYLYQKLRKRLSILM